MGQKPVGVPGACASTPALPEGKQVTELCAQHLIDKDPMKRSFIISLFPPQVMFIIQKSETTDERIYVYYDSDMIIIYMI